MAIDATPERFDAGRTLKRAFALLKSSPLKFLLWSVAFAGLPDAAMTYASQRFSRAESAFTSPTNWLLLTGTVLTSMLGSFALQAVIASRAARDDDGRGYSSPAAFGGPSDWLALGTLALVASLGIMAGFILLVIPGIILSLAWLVAVPAMVTERLGVMESIRRSNALTGNARGAIFGLSVAVGLAGWLGSWLFALVVAALDVPQFDLAAALANQTVIGLANALFAVAVYQELRWNKDGSPTDRLAEVFA